MYLVTGGCGFIGSHLVDLLLEQGHPVRILDDLSNGSTSYLPREAEFIQGSITDTALLQQALQGVEHIFHLAAIVSVPESVAQWHRSHLVNCGGTIRLFECAKKIPIVFASSAAVYGDSQTFPQNESSICKPLSPYAVDKLSCELHAQLAWKLFGTPSAACRFFNVYGPRQNASSPYSGVISKFAHSLACNNPITLYGDGNQRRDFIYVKDVAQMLYRTMQRLTEGVHLYNFCTGSAHTINALADLMMKITGIQVEKHYCPPRPGDLLISQGDPTKAAREMNVRTHTSLEQGLTQMMQEMQTRSI